VAEQSMPWLSFATAFGRNCVELALFAFGFIFRLPEVDLLIRLHGGD